MMTSSIATGTRSFTTSSGGSRIVAAVETSDVELMSSIEPSFGPLATAAEPSIVEAPARFSTITLLPVRAPSCCATARAKTSVLAPGAAGEDAAAFVKARVAEGSDYVKIILEDFSPEVGLPVMAGDKQIGTNGRER